MHKTESILVPAIQDLEEAVDDFHHVQFQAAVSTLERFVYLLDEEPIAGFLRSTVPSADFGAWWDRTKRTVGSMVGSGHLDWPIDRAERVAIQIALCRAICANEIQFLDFVHGYYAVGSKLSAHVLVFASSLLKPLIRDIRRLSETRPVSPFLFEAMGRLPRSGDVTLDELLQDACRRFRDPAPAARRDAIEKLWDAWERLKSLDVADNKRLSIQSLLDRATSNTAFRTQLDNEAKALTDIGNNFHIRHFEINKIPLTQPEQFDYLFHRLYALMHFLLFNRGRSNDKV